MGTRHRQGCGCELQVLADRFDADYWLAKLRDEKKVGNRYAWQRFRELWVPKWSDAFRETVFNLTRSREFTYLIAVTILKGDREAWRADPHIAENLPGCDVGFLTLSDIWGTLLAELTTRPAPSEVGRLVQILKAAGLTAPHAIAEPSGPAPGSDAARVEEAEIEARNT